MPENIENIVALSLFAAFWAFIIVAIIVRMVKNKLAPVKRVKAVVIGKHTVESFSRYSGNGKREKYVVTFSAEGKKLAFYVSPLTYNGYRLNDTGTLTYKGDRIIGFN